MLKLFLVLVLFFQLPSFAYNGKIAFDLDETLIESDKLDRKLMDAARELGYEIKKSLSGQDYIIRPGTYELLDFCQSRRL
jgi:hypothetical protein